VGRFVRGDVVVVPFPFSDLSANKRRPALVIAHIRPNRLFTAEGRIIAYRAGAVTAAKMDAVVEGIIAIITGT